MRTSFEDKRAMSAFDQAVQSDLEALVEMRARSMRTNKCFARAAIARETKVPQGTLESIKKGRLKGIRGWIGEQIQGALRREIEREMQRLQHEYEGLLNRGADSRSAQMAEIKEVIERARRSVDALK